MNNLKTSVAARVLLVDDSHQQLELRASILRKAGYSVLTAQCPIQALSLAVTMGEFDIAVVDYEMPSMNGGVLAKHLKAKFPKLNIVLYSAAVGIPSGYLRTVDAFIPKGEGVNVLLHHLEKVSAQIAGIRQHARFPTHYETPESPPGVVCAEPSFLPAVLAATNVT